MMRTPAMMMTTATAPAAAIAAATMTPARPPCTNAARP
jgi:hypothetical protein